MAGESIVSTLRKSMEEYLTMRRRMGFKLHEAGQRLEDFVSFMERRRFSHINGSLALTWAKKSPSVQPGPILAAAACA